MRITSKGQVTIPAEIREQAGLLPHTEVEFSIEDGVVKIRPVAAQKKPSRGAMLIDHLRRHRGDVAMSTEEIMALTRGEE
jgi:AbrB family looped-hinge helix DNA binding protein